MITPLNLSYGDFNFYKDVSIYRDTLYILGTTKVGVVDIRKYRPMSKNTKTTIPVQFATAGDTIPLKQFAPDAERFTFAVGFDKSSYLSINASNELVVGSGGNTVLVKLTAINRIDSIDLEFYLVILQASAPKWRDVDSLTMRAGSRYDLFRLVPDAESIAFRSGRTRLAGSSLSNGMFTIGTTGGVAEFTAQKGSLSSHIAITIDVLQGMGSERSEVSGYRVEIAGIDVTADLREFPTVSKTLDVISLNQYRVNDAVLTLRDNRGKYNPKIAGNFWKTNGLNAGGFNETIKIYIEGHVDGQSVSGLLFSGFLIQQAESISDVEVKLTCVDIANHLHKQIVSDFGTLEKWDTLRKQSDEDSYEGIYVPERSLLPMQEDTGEAWHDRTKLKMSGLQLRSEGPPQRNKAYMTANDFRTAGGFLPENPLLRFMGEHRSEDVRFLIHQLAINKEVYNAHIELPEVELEDAFILNRGSVAFSVEPTRSTLLPVDWVHDPSNNRVLILLSNPEGHIADQLVQYNLKDDSYRVLHTFDKKVSVHRIERRNATNYYILTSKKITQDRSALTLPRQTDGTGYGYDSLAEGNRAIKIYHYNSSTGTLTEHVAEEDSFPPQLSIHYHVGFENLLYVDEFEGIRPDYRGPFKWHSGNLYYRYAKDGEFGVARVNTSGTTTKMIVQTALNYHNHLNFAFDVASNGTLYMVHATGDSETSTLFIKRRTSNGTVTTVLSETRAVGDFNELGFDFGAFLGAHEVLFHDNNLYMLVPIQKVDLGDDTRSIINPDVNIEQRSAEKSGERNVTIATNLNPSNLTLAPGDDIPLRIDFDGSVSGATQDNLTVYGGTLQSFSISSDMIDVTIRPDSQTRHKNIIIDLAEDAVDQGNEAWRITIDFETQRSRRKSAGMVLYRVATNATTPTLTVVDKWDFVQNAGCNLTVHDGNVHYTEHPPASQKFKPYNPDLESYNTEMKYNVIEESLGALKKIDSSGTVESLGNLWFEERPYNVAATRCLSFDGDLHLMMGYGNLDEILRFNSLASAADNVQHLVLGRRLRYVMPTFSPNGSVYDALAEIARNVNGTLNFDNNLISIQERQAYRAETNGATGTGTGSLAFQNANKVFPSSGYLFIEGEILKYTGISGRAFTGISRGVLGTERVNHVNATEILYLNTVFGKSRILKNFNILEDTARIYNVIQDSDNRFKVKDEDSIARFGELSYPLNLGLTRHEGAWQEYIFEGYLASLKDVHSLINLPLKPSFFLELGDFVGFRFAELVYAAQIVSVRYERTQTILKARTL